MNKNNFLKVSKEFSLGSLTTEGFNPLTKGLSEHVKSNPIKAIQAIKNVDVYALECLKDKIDEAYALSVAIKKTIKNKRKVFLCGCGATGRLALSLEFLYLTIKKKNDVVSFMAGGDYALIKSVESFEDKMSYGIRQLCELGFENGDLLIGITEGGETSFVIGATMEASDVSSNKPFFIYCNPDSELIHIERSKNIIEDSSIKKINLTTSSMALSGSTRMQATTVQMFLVAQALFNNGSFKEFKHKYLKNLNILKDLNYFSLEKFINWESKVYKNKGHITYLCDSSIAIAVLTDTTERSPTFSLAPFEKVNEKELGLCYLAVKDTNDSSMAWNKLLKRNPRALNWPELNQKIDENELYKFDISLNAISRREKLSKNHHIFEISLKDNDLIFKNGSFESKFKASNDLYISHICLKLYMNTLSTLIMGHLNRYESNIMTWVRPSNYKLIDRAARYVIRLASEKGIELTYDEVVDEIFNCIPQNPNNSIVVTVLNNLIINR